MQAIILAAGLGTRMRPITNTIPKAMVPILGKSILDRTLEQLPSVVDEVIVVIGYLGEQIRAHLKDYVKHKIVFVESEPNGTGYSVKLCEPYITNNFLVLNGDDLYDQSDLQKLVGQDTAILVKKINQSGRFGAIIPDSAGFLLDIKPGEAGQEALINIGAYSLTPKYFTWSLAKTGSGEYGLPQTMLAQVPLGLKVKLIEASHWFPIAHPQDITAAEDYLRAKA